MPQGHDKVMLDVPFYADTGDGNQCGQVALKSVIEYFLGKKLPLDELDVLTARRPGQQSWTTQLVPPLHGLGLDARLFSSEDLEPYLEGEPFIRRHFGEQAGFVLANTNVDALVSSIRMITEHSMFERRVPSTGELEGWISGGHVPIILVDYNFVKGRGGPYLGHFMTVTGFDDENFYCHHSGPADPQANMPVSKGALVSGWNAKYTDNDLIVVYGKRRAMLT